ncbi:MAG: hypothetical protein ACP5M9_04045 [Candidatus Micrarchaeia archaeon]
MVIKFSKAEDEGAFRLLFRHDEEKQQRDEEKLTALKDTLRGIAEPKAKGSALRITNEVSELLNNGQMNVVLTESITPTIIGGKVLLQVGVISLNEETVKQALDASA